MMRLGFGHVTCEDCPSRTTAHIKKRQVFEGSPIHSLSPECEGLEYEMTEIFKCMIFPPMVKSSASLHLSRTWSNLVVQESVATSGVCRGGRCSLSLTADMSAMFMVYNSLHHTNYSKGINQTTNPER